MVNYIGIICAMKVESQDLLDSMKVESTEQISGITFYKGVLEGVNVVLATCGVGKVFAALCAQTMFLRFNVKWIINSGVAGSLSDVLKIGDLAISTALVQHDMDTSAVGDPVGLVSGINLVFFEADPALVQLTQDVARDLNINFEKGVIATGDQFVSSPERKAFIKKNFQAIAAEMEGAAIAQVCFINKIRFIVTRIMSDQADGASPKNYGEFVKTAAARSALITKELVQKIETL